MESEQILKCYYMELVNVKPGGYSSIERWSVFTALNYQKLKLKLLWKSINPIQNEALDIMKQQ